MDISIQPTLLHGEVTVPASKSILHRVLIAAALAEGTSVIQNSYLSQDILATVNCLKKLGASLQLQNGFIRVEGNRRLPQKASFDCCESGSTIRFLIPIAAAFGIDSEFHGKGKLVFRPLDVYQQAFEQKGISFDYDGLLPVHLSGQLQSGNYQIRGNISSQFITGLLFSLPLLQGDSTIEIIPPYESKSYVNITLSVLKTFGIEIVQSGPLSYFIPGGQSYQATNYCVESDYSQAAFFLTASCLGSQLTLRSFDSNSVQGDSAIISILKQASANPVFSEGTLSLSVNQLSAFEIEASDIPDLVPILCVLACFCDGISKIHKVERLKIKESDRIASTIEMITNLGGNISYTEATEHADSYLTITPVNEFHSAEINSYNDHRIVMAAAVAATRSNGTTIIHDAGAVKKSYPTFFEDYKALGGKSHVIHLD